MPRDIPDGLTFDIAFALIKALKIPRAHIKRSVTEQERFAMAAAIAAHLEYSEGRASRSAEHAAELVASRPGMTYSVIQFSTAASSVSELAT